MNARKILVSVGAAVATRRIAQFISNLDADDVLGTVGLQRRRSTALDSLGLIGLGALIGAGTALLVAPVSGRQTRSRISSQFDKLGRAATDAANGMMEEAEPYLSRVAGHEENSRSKARHTQ